MTDKEFQLIGADGQPRFARAWMPCRHLAGVVGIVHGLGEHSGRYHELAGQLNDSGFGVVAFDQQGHGNTSGPRGHVVRYEMLLDDVDALLREIERRADGKPQFLYGHSMGGAVVVNFALRRQPELSGLVAASPLLRLSITPPRWKFALAHVLNYVWPSATFHKGIAPSDLSQDVEAVQQYCDDALNHHSVSARLGIEMLAAGKWAVEHADELSLPALLMHGDADRVTSVTASREFAVRSSSQCTLKIWEGFLHDLHWETQRTEVYRYMIDWLLDRIGQRSDRGNGTD